MLYLTLREAEGRDGPPEAGIVDSQSLKSAAAHDHRPAFVRVSLARNDLRRWLFEAIRVRDRSRTVCGRAGLPRLGQYFEGLANDVNPDPCADDKIKRADLSNENGDTGNDHGHVGDEIRTGEDPCRPEMDFAVAISAEELENRGVHRESDGRDEDHQETPG
ncbi:MAG: hypothetical protein HLUCCO17_03660 [Saliniramus fredricksonii]|uniref:Uncharacterized protein n=1 Tax=Saliniramus fredricksonii TaxID=1653334 RepID=A0A0P7XAI1_9HYPH|nr:hypothetical protein [Saliniramus fredricksonii]KPQ12276.1 MAG: hypothetical protein HLUCCO17_03660 [Saliniramus fredricksonii]